MFSFNFSTDLQAIWSIEIIHPVHKIAIYTYTYVYVNDTKLFSIKNLWLERFLCIISLFLYKLLLLIYYHGEYILY